MKILVLSDSHASLRFMRLAVARLKPDHVIHLGDHYDDGQALAEENPHIIFHQVPGNCDRFRCAPWLQDTLCYPIGGVKIFMTHGHKHAVKSDTYRLLADARMNGASLVLYGHTHCPACHQEDDDLWVLNPGTCGSDGGSVGLVEIENKKISACRILRQTELFESE